MSIELRTFVEPIEFRSAEGKLTASGVAMRYGARSKPIDGKFRETFAPGSLSKTIQEQDIRSHYEHTGPYLGRTGAGTLRLIDSRSELAYELDLPDTTAGRDAAALLERGDVKGSSIGFRALPKGEAWTVEPDGMALRTVTQARLFRVDLTTSPYYEDSTAGIALRSLAVDLHLDPTVVEQAAADALAKLLDPEHRSTLEPGTGTGDGREAPTVHRRPAHWFS